MAQYEPVVAIVADKLTGRILCLTRLKFSVAHHIQGLPVHACPEGCREVIVTEQLTPGRSDFPDFTDNEIVDRCRVNPQTDRLQLLNE